MNIYVFSGAPVEISITRPAAVGRRPRKVKYLPAQTLIKQWYKVNYVSLLYLDLGQFTPELLTDMGI
jgi:hypothetical protein